MSGQRVVTWQTSSGRTMDVAPACEERMTAAGTWPQAYCQVSHGLHYASGGCACPECNPRTSAVVRRLQAAPPGRTRPPWVDGYKKGLSSPPAKVIVVDQLFPTPASLAARMVALADIRPEHRVLEPSAGTGNLARVVRGTYQPHTGPGLVVVEINQSLAHRLADITCAVHCADFLLLDATDLGWFDRIVMNPPFAKGQDVAHIRHAKTFLKPGGRLVTLCGAGPVQEKMLRPLSTSWEVIEGAFRDSGTGVRVAMLSMEA